MGVVGATGATGPQGVQGEMGVNGTDGESPSMALIQLVVEEAVRNYTESQITPG